MDGIPCLLDSTYDGLPYLLDCIDGEDGVIYEVNNSYVPVEFEEYAGPYTVIPTPRDQHFETEHKVMKEDLTVTAVPFWETSNDYGNTVYIASEV
jgi:hypothetical protein